MPKHKVRSTPPVGTVFVKKYKSKVYTLKVVKLNDGIGYQLGKTVFKSPSAAAKHLVRQPENGWEFWKMEA